MHEECGMETAVEDKAWSFLKNRCQLLLKLYPTTKQVRFARQTSSRKRHVPFSFQDDEKLLAEDVGQRRRMCVLLRLAEKRILLSGIDYASHKMRK